MGVASWVRLTARTEGREPAQLGWGIEGSDPEEEEGEQAVPLLPTHSEAAWRGLRERERETNKRVVGTTKASWRSLRGDPPPSLSHPTQGQP